MTNAPVIDRETIAMLREMDAISKEDNLLIELIDDFLFHSADQVTAIQLSADAQMERDLAAQSHSLKGACLNIGVLALFQVCDTIETLARQNKLDLMEELVAELARIYQKTALHLAELRRRIMNEETIEDLLG
jgi:HPt (histidine-containing phosphotransfer) domain-containing protein